MDKMLTLLTRIENREQDKIRVHQQKVDDESNSNSAILIASVIVSSLLIFGGILLLLSYVNNVERLHKKVQARNQEIISANEELTVMNESLQERQHKLEETRVMLQEREQQLLHAQKIARTGSIDWNLATDIITFTPEFKRILRLNDVNRDYTMADMYPLMHHDDAKRVAGEIQKAIKGRSSFQIEFRVVLNNQSTVHLLTSAEPYLDGNLVKGFIGAVTDISDQKTAQAELINSERKLRSVLEAAPDPIIISTADGVIQSVNAQAEFMFQYAKDELIGKNLNILLPQSYRGEEFGRGTYIENLNVGRNTFGVSLTAFRKDKKEFPVEVNFSPLVTSEGPILIAAIRDVTFRRMAEEKILLANEKLAEANKTLQKANDELSSFSYSISHDLRAPLRAINGYTAILAEDHIDVLNERGLKALKTIQSNSSRMDQLINDLLELARLGHHSMTMTNFRMDDLLDRILTDKDISQRVSVSIAPMPEVVGDYNLMRQVWENLINNALKFSSHQTAPKIEIGYQEEENEHVFSVIDNGVGFDSTYTDKLFKVFSRLHGKNEFEGTGAGLAIAKKIIDAHGGQIWARSEKGHGAAFYFTLPKHREG
jgi:PAS domain S-box-containing protein